ncbi:hypothetical protein RHMOL_Rhmol05G0164700 [Rhododendron molle]|uniref:Uncharacterized protein n=1 Tax=Rhododendron molle TaxID=49168 RepID=A0ACC0NPL4_RHOML|nr:hypothetical protein RHMOL_Rhmol05G0164700 [Rhododendron molle]
MWDPWKTSGTEPEYLARSRAVTASRVLLESAFGWQWYLGDLVTRQSLGYLEFQVPGPLPPRASHTSDYTLAELERFTRPDTKLTRHLRPEMDYAAYQRDRLVRPLGVRAHREVQEQARGAAEQRRAAAEIQRGGKGRVTHRESRPVVGGPPELPWTVKVVDSSSLSPHRGGRPLRKECDLHREHRLLHLQLLQDIPGAHNLPQQPKRQPGRRWHGQKSEVEGEGGEEEARSDSDDTADDPSYLQDPTENIDDDDGGGDDDDDGGGDDDDDGGDIDWFGQSEG